MPNVDSEEPTRRNQLRLWPGVVAVALQWVARFVVPIVAPEAITFGVIAGLVGGLAIVVWWAFFSRASRFDRLGGVALMAVALVATSQIVHESIATAMMGMMFIIYAVPLLSLPFVVWAVTTRKLADRPRRAAMIATILLVCGGLALVRTGGFTGDLDQDCAWRWAESPEERLLARSGDEPASNPLVSTGPERGADWTGFRGPDRNGIVPGVRIATDWSASPPVELWRRALGPGWSSFAVHGDLFFTQEQRGDHEVVACYSLTTGEPVWRHLDAARFWEANAGAGPRGTPTLSDGRVYTLGGTGILNVLDADDGTVVWSRNAAADTEVKVPYWGFAGSPLVVDDVVIAAAAGTLVAYDLNTGSPRWSGPPGGDGYSSPHLLTIDGIRQVLLMDGDGATSVAPADGTLLWEHSWPGGSRIVQPALTANGDLLISAGEGRGGTGLRRVAVRQEAGAWTVEERWTSTGLKPYFNDFVVHKGNAFGFDRSIMACVDVEDGTRRWKGGRYGFGQLVLLPDQDVLLVLSEKGDLALVAATPDRFAELARFPAIEGKTWNHPVLVGDILLVRNGEEMVAFRLTLAQGGHAVL